MTGKIYIGKTLGSFLLVLFTMPLGHALMMLMEHFMQPTLLPTPPSSWASWGWSSPWWASS